MPKHELIRAEEGFNNEIIKAPNPDKPHIVKIGGLWRVSQIEPPYGPKLYLFNQAYHFVNKLNLPLLEKMFNKEK